jgi:hypothetical protein
MCAWRPASSSGIFAAAAGHDFVVAAHHVRGGGVVFMTIRFILALQTCVVLVLSKAVGPAAAARKPTVGRWSGGSSISRRRNGSGVSTDRGYDDCAVGAVILNTMIT